MSKYNNQKIKNAYGEFDSQKEWARWLFLTSRQKEGKINDLKRQVEFTLIPAQYRSEIKHLKTRDKEVQVLVERECSYRADFTYMRDGRLVVEDVKGEDKYYGKGKKFSTQTPDFKIKKKLMLWVHHIEIKIVTEPTQWEV